METGVRCLRIATEWAPTKEHIGDPAEAETHKFVTVPVSAIV